MYPLIRFDPKNKHVGTSKNRTHRYATGTELFITTATATEAGRKKTEKKTEQAPQFRSCTARCGTPNDALVTSRRPPTTRTTSSPDAMNRYLDRLTQMQCDSNLLLAHLQTHRMTRKKDRKIDR